MPYRRLHAVRCRERLQRRDDGNVGKITTTALLERGYNTRPRSDRLRARQPGHHDPAVDPMIVYGILARSRLFVCSRRAPAGAARRRTVLCLHHPRVHDLAGADCPQGRDFFLARAPDRALESRAGALLVVIVPAAFTGLARLPKAAASSCGNAFAARSPDGSSRGNCSSNP